MKFEVGGCGKSKLIKSGQNTVPSSSNPNQQRQFPESPGAWTQVGRFWVEAESCKLWTMEEVWCKSPDALLGTAASLVWEIRGRSPSCPWLLKWGESPREKRAREEVVPCSLCKLLPRLRLTSELCVQRALQMRLKHLNGIWAAATVAESVCNLNLTKVIINKN